METNEYHFWIQHKKLVKKDILFQEKYDSHKNCSPVLFQQKNGIIQVKSVEFF